jgi:type II secretory pathway pseudopilin PulG
MILRKGFTYFELLVVMIITMVMATIILLYVNPKEFKERSRDNRRLLDISVLEDAIIDYRTDNGSYPDEDDVVRDSMTLVDGGGRLDLSSNGWIGADLSPHLTKMPLDPINDVSYHYSYSKSENVYEINGVLEFYTDRMVQDGGDNDSVYEVGSDLTLIN